MPFASTLDGLRDIHWPAAAEPSQAAGYAAAALAGFALAVVVYVVVRAVGSRRRPARRAALSALASCRGLPADERLAAQAALLRGAVAGLAGAPAAERGDVWLARLDAIFATRFFTAGAGTAFGDALYAPEPAPVEAIDRELAVLLRRLRG